VFIPYHWPGRKAVNQLTNRAVDPLSKMPEFKVAAVRVERAGGHTSTTDARDLELHGEQP
jgi:assimilatory nitrate reductase catalytic subunit